MVCKKVSWHSERLVGWDASLTLARALPQLGIEKLVNRQCRE